MTNRRYALRSMGALALLIGHGNLAFGASIVAVRVWPAADYTRVTSVDSHMLNAEGREPIAKRQAACGFLERRCRNFAETDLLPERPCVVGFQGRECGLDRRVCRDARHIVRAHRFALGVRRLCRPHGDRHDDECTGTTDATCRLEGQGLGLGAK